MVASVIEWLERNHGHAAGIDFVKGPHGLQGRKLAGATTIRVPVAVAITEHNARQGFGDEVFGRLGAPTATKLWFLRMRDAGEAAEYMEVLPTLREMNLPIVWSDQELALLKGTNLGAAVPGRRAMVEKEWKEAMAVLGQEVREPAWTELETPGAWNSFLAFVYATSIFLSRLFPGWLVDKSYTSPILLPVADFLNHRPGAKVEWGVQDNVYTYTCLDDLAEGDEVYQNYGQKGNEELLMGYGFALEDNAAADVAALRIKVPLELLPVMVEQYGIGLPDVEVQSRAAYETPGDLETAAKVPADYAAYANGLVFHVSREVVPDSLINVFGVLLRNEHECGPVVHPSGKPISLRLRLDGLVRLSQALAHKVAQLAVAVDATNVAPAVVRTVNIYRDSQLAVHKSALKIVRYVERALLKHNKQAYTCKRVAKLDAEFASQVCEAFGWSLLEEGSEAAMLLWLVVAGRKGGPKDLARVVRDTTLSLAVTEEMVRDYMETYQALKQGPIADLTMREVVVAGTVLGQTSYEREDGETVVVGDAWCVAEIEV